MVIKHKRWSYLLCLKFFRAFNFFNFSTKSFLQNFLKYNKTLNKYSTKAQGLLFRMHIGQINKCFVKLSTTLTCTTLLLCSPRLISLFKSDIFRMGAGAEAKLHIAFRKASARMYSLS